jgi:hypothetical protein
MMAIHSSTPLPKAVYTTGAFLEAIEVELNGTKQWRWIVTRFEDDTFCEGQMLDAISEYGTTYQDLGVGVVPSE